jgi:hypothetical protein
MPNLEASCSQFKEPADKTEAAHELTSLVNRELQASVIEVCSHGLADHPHCCSAGRMNLPGSEREKAGTGVPSGTASIGRSDDVLMGELMAEFSNQIPHLLHRISVGQPLTRKSVQALRTLVKLVNR